MAAESSGPKASLFASIPSTEAAGVSSTRTAPYMLSSIARSSVNASGLSTPGGTVGWMYTTVAAASSVPAAAVSPRWEIMIAESSTTKGRFGVDITRLRVGAARSSKGPSASYRMA